MNQNVYFIQVFNAKEKYRIQTIWNNTNNNITITILEGNKAFQSSINKTALNKQAKKYEIDFEEYINTLRLCLSLSNLEDFTYNVKENTFSISRTVKKFSRQFADFNLDIIDFTVASASFIDELIKCNDVYQNQITICKEEKDVAINEKNIYLEKLEHYVKEKEKMENELYSKFILLLNEKKLRIQYLTDLITKQKQNPIDDDDDLKIKIKNLNNKEVISESETDSEDEKTTEKIVHQVQIEVEPKENDLFDYDTEEMPLQTLPKRNKGRKNNETNKEQKKNQPSANAKKTNEHNLDDIIDASETEDNQEFNTQNLNDLL